MKIGIMADSHDNLPLIRRAIDRLQAEGAECLIHAGDFIAPFAVREILKFNGPVHGCFGNNDGERAGIRRLWPEVADPPRKLSLGGRNVLLVHDVAQAGPKDLAWADVFVSGHSHQPSVEKVKDEAGEHLRINPGESGGWLSGRSTIALLDTETLEARILEL